MVETTDEVTMDDGTPAKGSGRLIFLVLVVSLLLGGGGFFAAFSGLVPKPGFLGGATVETAADEAPQTTPSDRGIAFLPLGQIIIPLSPRARAQHLLMEAELEVDAAELTAVEQLKPRILDMMNTYLRAIDETDLDDPSAVLRLRAQLLRRVSVVAAPTRPRDLLITSFILK